MSTGGTTNKERARAQLRQALRVIEGFFFTIKFSLKLVNFLALIWHFLIIPSFYSLKVNNLLITTILKIQLKLYKHLTL